MYVFVYVYMCICKCVYMCVYVYVYTDITHIRIHTYIINTMEVSRKFSTRKGKVLKLFPFYLFEN